MTDARLEKDLHFRPQVRALQPEAIPYSRIYDLRDFAMRMLDPGEHEAA